MDEGDRDRPASTRGAGDHPSYGAPLLNPPINYQSEYSQESHNRQQPFPSYGTSLVYNIPQSTHSHTYGSMQSYPPRQNAAIEVLSSQFAGAPPYYVPGESSTPVGPSVTHHQQSSSQFSSPSYSQYSPAPARIAQPYLQNPADIGQAGQSEPIEDEFAQQHHAAALDEAYSQYQNALKRTFQNMRDGRLGEAGTSLLTISDWLLSNAVELGLVRDEQELHGDRTRLWNEFNTCWLCVLQKNKEMIQESIATGQPPLSPREILREDFLERMGRELVRLCDGMERHGLVDYQMGVWEEEIIDALQECLDLLEGTTSSAAPERSGSASGSRNPENQSSA